MSAKQSELDAAVIEAAEAACDFLYQGYVERAGAEVTRAFVEAVRARRAAMRPSPGMILFDIVQSHAGWPPRDFGSLNEHQKTYWAREAAKIAATDEPTEDR